MSFLHEHFILPLSDLLKGEHTYKYLKFIRTSEHWSDEQLRHYQNDKIQSLIRYAALYVPFYRDWFQTTRVNPLEIHSREDLLQLPIVNKDIMRREGIDRFSTEHYPDKKRIPSRSSGSTGEPFAFYETKDSYSFNVAAKLNTWYKAGYRLGNRYMKIANGKRPSTLKRLQDKVNACLFVPYYSLNDNQIKEILDSIEHHQPSIIRSYPIPIYLIAQYRQKHPNYTFCPIHIMTTGATLTQDMRETIEGAFGCDIIDSYSCEGTLNCYETPEHDYYHQTDTYGIIEVLDANNNPVLNGVGRVVSTDFWNKAHPFIRYDTKDLVEVREGRITRILGRECESYVMANGNRFTVHNFSRFFLHDLTSVSAYQIVKKTDGSILFRLVPNDQYSDSVEQLIIDHWSKLFGTPVMVELVVEIPLMRNNKRLTIVDE